MNTKKTERPANFLARLPEIVVIGALATAGGWLLRDREASTIKEMRIEALERKSQTFERKLEARESFMQCSVILEVWRDGGSVGEKPCKLEVME